MSEQTDQFDRLLGSETKSPFTRGQLPRKEREWLADTGADLTSLVRVGRLKASHPEKWKALFEAVSHSEKRRVLVTIYANGGDATYDEIERDTTVTRRMIRKYVADLEDDEILSRVQSRVTRVQYAEEAMEVLVSEALSSYFTDWTR